jgi:uncharacterized membrane protein
MDATAVRASPRRSASAPLFLRIGFWLCIAIAIAVVIRRIAALVWPTTSGPPGLAEIDRVFANHAALTLAHILPALLFVILAPIVLFAKTHWAEQLLLFTGAIVGITAYGMSIYSIGGWVERSAVLFFNTLFLYSLWRAFRERARGLNNRRWIVRAIVILLGIATTRPVMGVFFATSPLTHWRPSQFFGVAFWIGFSINWLVVELWLRRKRTA